MNANSSNASRRFVSMFFFVLQIKQFCRSACVFTDLGQVTAREPDARSQLVHGQIVGGQYM